MFHRMFVRQCAQQGMHPWMRGFGHHHGHGPWGGKGSGRWGEGGRRRFGRGDLKYVILDLLKDQPRHGYDVIRAMEERFGGLYSPSPGSVYPTLQLLEDQGYLRSLEQDGKRVYTITDEGRAFLEERSATVENLRQRMGGWGPKANPELGGLMQEVRQLGQVILREGARGALNDPDKARLLRDAVARARVEIEAIFAGDTRAV